MSRQFLCYTGAMNENDRSPLHIVVCDADIDSVRRLIAENKDPNIRDSSGETPLHYAVASGKEDIEIVRLLLESGADVNAKEDHCACTPLHLVALRGGPVDIARALVAGGADVNAHDLYGETPLDLAIGFQIDVELSLVKNSETPPHNDAEVLERRELIKLLKKHGAEMG